MLFPDLKNIKLRRLRSGIGQKDLARLSNVSQSLIAKLEAGKIEPSYNVVVRIFLVLENIEHSSERKCFEIMTKKVISVSKDEKVAKVAELMKKNSISQLPVMEGNVIVGSISENLIFSKLLECSKKTLCVKTVGEIMVESYPVVSGEMPVSVVLPMLKSTEAILIKGKKELEGIITKANLI